MKKIYIAVCACLLLAGCQNQNQEQQSKTETMPTTEAVTTAITENTTTISETTTAAEPSEDVFVDHDGIKITSKGLGFSEKFAAIIIEIDNQSAQDVVVQTRDFSVNGYMCKAALSQEVAAGKKAKQTFGFLKMNLQKTA